jgi:hypothetical protein
VGNAAGRPERRGGAPARAVQAAAAGFRLSVMSAADDRDALLSPSRHISVHLPATPSMPGAPLYPDGADLEPDTTAFVKRPGARDGLAGHSQALPGAPPPGADAGAPAADAPAAAREVADAAAGAAVQAPAVRPVDDDYVLSVAADGTTTARPSRKHGGEATLSEGRAGGRAHAGAPRVAFAGPSRQKPSTPLVLHPWEDRAHSESDYSAMLRGIRAKAASQVQEPSHTEATNIRVGSTVSLAGGEAMAVKLFLNPRSPERKSSKSPQKEREVELRFGSCCARLPELPVSCPFRRWPLLPPLQHLARHA